MRPSGDQSYSHVQIPPAKSVSLRPQPHRQWSAADCESRRRSLRSPLVQLPAALRPKAHSRRRVRRSSFHPATSAGPSGTLSTRLASSRARLWRRPRRVATGLSDRDQKEMRSAGLSGDQAILPTRADPDRRIHPRHILYINDSAPTVRDTQATRFPSGEISTC